MSCPLVSRRAQRPYRHPVLRRLHGLIKARLYTSARSLRAALRWRIEKFPGVVSAVRRRPMQLVKRVVRLALPPSVHELLRTAWYGPEYSLEVEKLNLGSLRRVEPISRNWGFDRGQPIDRYYIENFLALHADDIRGRVLEIKDDTYTRRYGGGRVTRSDVLDIVRDNPRATIVADLTSADQIPSDAFDCVILTQTLQYIYDVRAAVRTLHRILKAGGVLLATLPGISQTADQGWCWRFTSLSARRLFEESFPASILRIEAFGNVLAAVSFLRGLAVKELRQDELDHHDPEYAIAMAVRAVKPESRAA